MTSFCFGVTNDLDSQTQASIAITCTYITSREQSMLPNYKKLHRQVHQNYVRKLFVDHGGYVIT